MAAARPQPHALYRMYFSRGQGKRASGRLISAKFSKRARRARAPTAPGRASVARENLIFSHTGSKCYTLSDFDPIGSITIAANAICKQHAKTHRRRRLFKLLQRRHRVAQRAIRAQLEVGLGPLRSAWACERRLGQLGGGGQPCDAGDLPWQRSGAVGVHSRVVRTKGHASISRYVV